MNGVSTRNIYAAIAALLLATSGNVLAGTYSDMTVDVSALPADKAFLRDIVLVRHYERVPSSSEGKTLSVRFELDPSIPGENAEVKIADGRAVVCGGRFRSLVFGAGRFLRAIRYSERTFDVADGTYAYRPASKFRRAYLARHFDNWYHRASADELVRYAEDLVLWGFNGFSMQLVYPEVDLAKSTPGERTCFAGVTAAFAERMKALELDLISPGGSNTAPADMPPAYHAVPNREPWRGATEFNVCPEKPGAREYLLGLQERAVRQMDGLPVTGFTYWPFDEGGCSCARCSPWGGNGYPRLIEEYRRINERLAPHAQHIVSTWLFKDEDWELFYRYLEGHDWISALIVDSHDDFPRYPIDHPVPKGIPVLTFPEISMWGRHPWGGNGANPLPKRFERLFRQAEKVAKGFQLYSEGIFEDVNKIVVNGLYGDPGRSARDILAEYAAWELPGCDADDFNALVEMLEDIYQTRVEGRGLTRGNNVSWYLQHADDAELSRRAAVAARASALAERMDRAILPRMRQAWRWRILYLRAKIDAALYATRDARTPAVLPAYGELIRIYHAERQAGEVLRAQKLTGFTCPPVRDNDDWLNL